MPRVAGPGTSLERHAEVAFFVEDRRLTGEIEAVLSTEPGNDQLSVLAEDGFMYLVSVPELTGRLRPKPCGCGDSVPNKWLRRVGDEDVYTTFYECERCGTEFSIETWTAMEW